MAILPGSVRPLARRVSGRPLAEEDLSSAVIGDRASEADCSGGVSQLHRINLPQTSRILHHSLWLWLLH